LSEDGAKGKGDVAMRPLAKARARQREARLVWACSFLGACQKGSLREMIKVHGSHELQKPNLSPVVQTTPSQTGSGGSNCFAWAKSVFGPAAVLRTRPPPAPSDRLRRGAGEAAVGSRAVGTEAPKPSDRSRTGNRPWALPQPPSSSRRICFCDMTAPPCVLATRLAENDQRNFRITIVPN
jgi:hypothetical protein